MSVEKKIIEILAEQAVLEPSDITADMKLDDIGLDSMGLVETVFAIVAIWICQCFDVEISNHKHGFNCAPASEPISRIPKHTFERESQWEPS